MGCKIPWALMETARSARSFLSNFFLGCSLLAISDDMFKFYKFSIFDILSLDESKNDNPLPSFLFS